VAICLGPVNSTFDGFRRLAHLHDEIRTLDAGIIEVDLSSCTWLDANMCAPLGAILTLRKDKQIRMKAVRDGLLDILQKNGFLPNFGFDRPKKPDTFGTTIEYRCFERTDIRGFMGYVAQQFEGKGLPQMTAALRRRFTESIAELFGNAMEHSETQHGIFACGQWFPRRHRLDFSVADLGIGIRERILRSTGSHLEAEEAIAWAVDADNTTRHPGEGKPGGLGLKLIKEFINLNGGSIQIASDRGHWRFQRGQEELKRFDTPFPGTAVNIEIDTADTQTYCLSSEIDPTDIPF